MDNGYGHPMITSLITETNGMFDFIGNLQTHMPFATFGKDDGIIQTCCIMVEGLWKVHIFDGKEWRRVNTGMPEDATECSPFIEYDPMSAMMSMTFIAGASKEKGYMRFAMYRIDDLTHPSARKIIDANCGFFWKTILVHAGGAGAISIDKCDTTTAIEIRNCEYNYRVTSTGRSLFEILATGQMNGGEIFTWLIDTHFKKAYAITSNGEPLYKPCLINGEWYHCRKIGEGFEDRKIEKADNVALIPLDWDGNIVMDRHEILHEDEMQ